ncbi:MAG: hypothetical protein ACR2P0_13295 [Acidimicrobiales bacterium]
MTGRKTPLRARLVLGVWTLAIWGSRLRNAIVDDDLDGGERISATAIAVVFVVLGAGVLLTLWRQLRPHRSLVRVLAVAGVLRFTVRGPIVLASDEWSSGFKAVHTILWAVTAALSVWAWRELRSARVVERVSVSEPT